MESPQLLALTIEDVMDVAGEVLTDRTWTAGRTAASRHRYERAVEVFINLQGLVAERNASRRQGEDHPATDQMITAFALELADLAVAAIADGSCGEVEGITALTCVRELDRKYRDLAPAFAGLRQLGGATSQAAATKKERMGSPINE